MTQAIQVDDARLWDDTLLSLPNPHALQSWAWGEFKGRHGWSALRLFYPDGGSVVGAAQVLRRRLPGLPFSILYVPKGPTLDWSDEGRATLILSALEDLARRRGEIHELQTRETVQTIRVAVPLAETFGYATKLRSLTQGRATYSLLVAGYEVVPSGLREEIVRQRGY